MDANTAIRLKDITKTFGPVVANDKISLEVDRGEILALLGENGSGKTTLMNMLSGIYAPNKGEILVDGKPSDLVRVNQAFAGTYLEKGEHTIEFCFFPPGKTAGCAVSTAASIGYVVYLLYTFLLQTKRNIGRNRL